MNATSSLSAHSQYAPKPLDISVFGVALDMFGNLGRASSAVATKGTSAGSGADAAVFEKVSGDQRVGLA